MPPRTTRKSHRRTVSDRTMVGTAQPLCLWRPKPKGIVTTSPWTWEQQNSKRLIATRGWMTRSLPVGGEVFFLTSLFIERDFRNVGISGKPVSGNRGGLKGSTQHWLAVYPPEFEIPRF